MFAKKSKTHAQKFKSDILKSYKISGKLFGYGASARSSTLLNYCKLSNKQIDFIIDQNPLKQNLYTPGTNIPIRSMKDSIKNLANKNMVLLAWNFKDEIVKREKAYLDNGGKLMFPMPYPHVVTNRGEEKL